LGQLDEPDNNADEDCVKKEAEQLPVGRLGEDPVNAERGER
jgi:hypothetical protein